MTTLRIQNIVCPHCKNKMYSIGMISFTLRNSEAFSDGKVISNPPRPNEENILICSECYNAFWKDDALFDDGKYEELVDELPEANRITDLFPGFKADHKLKLASYYNELLDKGFANTTEREIYIRLELWRTFNDCVRFKSKTMSVKTIGLFNTNLICLIAIFKPKNEEEQLLLVEMYRELGEFEKASELLKNINWTNNTVAFQQIKSAIYTKKSTVFKIRV